MATLQGRGLHMQQLTLTVCGCGRALATCMLRCAWPSRSAGCDDVTVPPLMQRSHVKCCGCSLQLWSPTILRLELALLTTLANPDSRHFTIGM